MSKHNPHKFLEALNQVIDLFEIPVEHFTIETIWEAYQFVEEEVKRNCKIIQALYNALDAQWDDEDEKEENK